MYKIYVLFILCISSFYCQAQETYEDFVKEINESIPQDFYQKREQLLRIGNELAAYLPSGHSINGNVDYTKELQRGIDRGGIILLPDYPLLVNEKGLQIRSNTKLVFRENSKLIMKANSETHYAVLDITTVENVDVYFANIEGDRDGHLISNGEWGMGIRVQGSQNINLYAPTITNCWGDGIYIRGFGDIHSEKVSVHNFKIHRARRNGISVISVNNLLLNKGVISDTHGTAPQSAIDIEPNRPSDILKNLVIRDLTTHNSQGDGLMILLSNLTLKHAKNKSGQKVNITIENHVDVGSQYAVRITGRPIDDTGNKYEKSLKIDGEITFKNPKWIWGKSDSPVRFSPKKDRVLEYGFNPIVRFDNITILDNRRKKSKTQKTFVKTILKETKKL